ncbi:MAG TPA: efflux RND transporter permease subunit, partial [Gammaproteobacteria bacterium]|nr:efflux RND transporter permease subunit [Gammaproteobacteria bacterium]
MTSDTQTTQQELGFAGTLAKMFIQSPLSPLLFIGMLGMGMMGLIITPRQEDPEISVPLIDIFLSYPGASAGQVESLAINPLERAMTEIPGVKHVYSVSQRERGIVTIQFKVGENIGESLVKVHDKLQSHMDKIPPGVQQPLVKGKGSDDVPIVNLTLWSKTHDGGNLRRLAVNLLQQLNQIPNTGQGFVVGGRSEQIRIDVRPERLSGYGISLDQVTGAIRSANQESSVGHVESSNHAMVVYAGGFLKNALDVSQLMIGTSAGSPVYMRDVASIYGGLEEPTELVTFSTGPAYGEHETATTENGEEAGEHQEKTAYAAQAITIAIAKKIGTNGVDVANAVLKKVESLQKTMIPGDIQIEVTRNYGETAKEKVDELLFKLIV